MGSFELPEANINKHKQFRYDRLVQKNTFSLRTVM